MSEGLPGDRLDNVAQSLGVGRTTIERAKAVGVSERSIPRLPRHRDVHAGRTRSTAWFLELRLAQADVAHMKKEQR